MSNLEDLQEAFDKVKELNLYTSDYQKIVDVICDYGNKCIDRTTKEAIEIMKQNYGA